MNNIVKDYENHLLASDKKIKGIRHSVSVLTEYLGNTDFLTLNYRDAQNFQSWMVDQGTRYSPSSIQSIIGPLSAFYDYLKKKKLITVNPFTLIDRIKSPLRLPGNISDEAEMESILDHLAKFTRGKDLTCFKRDYRAHVLCELLYSTGMRISEAAAIRCEDIDFANSSVLVRDSKTKSERTAFLNDYVKNILYTYVNEMREQVLFFKNGGDKELLFGASVHLKTWLNGVLAGVCREMGREKVTSHIFRHAFGYHMLRAGCDVRKIQKFLGHSRLSTTGVYTKVDTESLRNILDQYHPRKVGSK